MPFSALRATAISLLVVYAAWNIVFLLQRRPAPSLLLALTGLPCPTTGMTRSLTCLRRGELGASLWWNPLSVPMAFLFCLCVFWLLRCVLWRRRLVLPQWVFWCWVFVLGLAWVAKLGMGPRTW